MYPFYMGISLHRCLELVWVGCVFSCSVCVLMEGLQLLSTHATMHLMGIEWVLKTLANGQYACIAALLGYITVIVWLQGC